MQRIILAFVGILLIYPAIHVTGILKDWADTNLTLNTYGDFFFGLLPFIIIGAGILGIFRAISYFGKSKSGEE